MRKLLVFSGLLALILGSAATAQARSIYYNELIAAYENIKIATTTKCQTCHNGRTPNAFAKDWVTHVLRQPNNHDVGYQLLADLDSDQDGVSNVQEMRQGTNPGKKDTFEIRLRRDSGN